MSNPYSFTFNTPLYFVGPSRCCNNCTFLSPVHSLLVSCHFLMWKINHCKLFIYFLASSRVCLHSNQCNGWDNKSKFLTRICLNSPYWYLVLQISLIYFPQGRQAINYSALLTDDEFIRVLNMILYSIKNVSNQRKQTRLRRPPRRSGSHIFQSTTSPLNAITPNRSTTRVIISIRG